MIDPLIVKCIRSEMSKIFDVFPEKLPRVKWKLIKKVLSIVREEICIGLRRCSEYFRQFSMYSHSAASEG